jgi:hypothetical protein
MTQVACTARPPPGTDSLCGRSWITPINHHTESYGRSSRSWCDLITERNFAQNRAIYFAKPTLFIQQIKEKSYLADLERTKVTFVISNCFASSCPSSLPHWLGLLNTLPFANGIARTVSCKTKQLIASAGCAVVTSHPRRLLHRQQ